MHAILYVIVEAINQNFEELASGNQYTALVLIIVHGTAMQ